MIDRKIIQEHFPTFEIALVDEIIKEGTLVNLDIDDLLISEGQYIKAFPLVLQGSIKISRMDNVGDELLLYYLNKGEVCTMALTCCSTGVRSNIKAIVTQDADIIKIPVKYIDEWMFKYPTWKKFIMDSFRYRFDELLMTIDSIAFMKMDERLLKYFKNFYQTSNEKIFTGSHQDIANDLHSSREVISRLLKQMENKKLVILSRNKIDFSALV
ncbi:MAG: Crp/Fnr family transcriptional regulator [Marinifilaceae bacterium]